MSLVTAVSRTGSRIHAVEADFTVRNTGRLAKSLCGITVTASKYQLFLASELNTTNCYLCCVRGQKLQRQKNEWK